jgi:hypothetical protein
MNQLQNCIGIVGSITMDDIELTDRHYRKVGGVITYAGLTYRRHGLSVLGVSNLARQDSKIKSKLAAHGIKIICGKSKQTTHFVNRQNGPRRDQMMTQTARKIEFKQIQQIIGVVDGLHLGPLHPLDIDPVAYSMLKNTNQKIFLDVQGLTRRIADRQVHRGISIHLAAGLQVANIIKANEREHRTMLDFYQLNLSEFMRRFKIEEYVVTLGINGGFVQTCFGDRIDYNAAASGAVEDPTGAGDVFFAAYIVNRFFNQMQIRNACQSAARVAARQVAGNYIPFSQLNPDT